MADGKAFDVHTSAIGILEPFDSVRSKDQIQSERAVLQLHKDLAPYDLCRLAVGQVKSQLTQCKAECMPVPRIFLDEQISALCCVWKPKKNSADLPMKRYRTSRRAKASLNFSASRYSNAGIA